MRFQSLINFPNHLLNSSPNSSFFNPKWILVLRKSCGLPTSKRLQSIWGNTTKQPSILQIALNQSFLLMKLFLALLSNKHMLL